MVIKILGTGCSDCQKLEANAKKAIEKLGLKDIQVIHIYDLNEIIETGTYRNSTSPNFLVKK